MSVEGPGANGRPRISVVVPSYGRPDALEECMAALRAQSRAPDEVVIVTREDDEATRSLVASAREERRLELREEVVDAPGQITALNAGCLAATGDVVAVTDDDAAPREDWLRRLEERFQDPGVSGVGGRDVIAAASGDPRRDEVGRVRWNGKLIGNHHVGRGGVREVDVLKGVNMAFRKRALESNEFDPRLRGRGAQVHNDLRLCLSIRGSGGRLLYDPELIVDHNPAERPQGDLREVFSAEQHEDAVHNETLALLEYLPPYRRPVFAVWSVVFGRGSSPGIVHTVAMKVYRKRDHSWRRLVATMRGRAAGWATFRSTR